MKANELKKNIDSCGINYGAEYYVRKIVAPALVQIMENQEKIIENQKTLGNRIVNIETEVNYIGVNI